MRTKIILADDHKILREGIKAILERESDIEVIGEADDGLKALKLLEKLKADVIILDISMPNMNGIEVAQNISSKYPDIKIIALSMHKDKRFVANMLQSGASGFILKDCAARELIEAVHFVMSNKIYLCSSITDIALKDYVKILHNSDNSIFKKLSNREREILQLLVEGKSTKEIADILFISVKTVESHRQQVMKKLNIHNIAELTKYAIREGITSLD